MGGGAEKCINLIFTNLISKTVWKYVVVFCYPEVLYNRIGAQQRAVKAVQPFPDDRLVLR